LSDSTFPFEKPVIIQIMNTFKPNQKVKIVKGEQSGKTGFVIDIMAIHGSIKEGMIPVSETLIPKDHYYWFPPSFLELFRA